MINKRLDYLDCAKGLGILLVILVHIYAWNTDIKRETFVIWVHSYHMPLFFIISGMLVGYKKYEDVKSFIISKVKHLLIPYIIFCFYNLIINMIVDGFDVNNIFLNIIYIFTLKGINDMWFLQTLFFAEIIFILLNKTIKNKYIKNCIIAILFIGSLFITKENGFLIYFPARVLISLGYIYSGYILINIIDNIKIKNIYLIIILVIQLFLANYNGFVDLNNLIFSNKFLYVLNSLLGSTIIIVLFKNIDIKNKILRYFGINSLILYSTHTILIYLFRKFINTGMDGYISGLVPFILILLLEIPIIYTINNFMPWILGKTNKKTKNI